MPNVSNRLWSGLPAALGLCLLLGSSEPAQEPESPGLQDAKALGCTQDLTNPGRMSDIVSNALGRAFGVHGSSVGDYLGTAKVQYETGEELLAGAAAHFEIDQVSLQEQVIAFQHVNCFHGPVGGADNGIRDNFKNGEWVKREESVTALAADNIEATPFARDVITHVVLHELGHALVREFDLPVLGNEETLADAFATYYLTSFLPERAEAVLRARVQSFLVEAAEVPREEWTVAGEHNSDARRAFQIAALSVAADKQKYASVARAAGMSADDLRRAADYGTEVHRSWRRILAPLWMPEGRSSNEVNLRYDQVRLLSSLCDGGLAEDLRGVLRRFDWHSQVSIVFRSGEGGAGWNRSRRTVTVNSEYVRRFVKQGELIEAKALSEEASPASAGQRE